MYECSTHHQLQLQCILKPVSGDYLFSPWTNQAFVSSNSQSCSKRDHKVEEAVQQMMAQVEDLSMSERESLHSLLCEFGEVTSQGDCDLRHTDVVKHSTNPPACMKNTHPFIKEMNRRDLCRRCCQQYHRTCPRSLVITSSAGKQERLYLILCRFQESEPSDEERLLGHYHE